VIQDYINSQAKRYASKWLVLAIDTSIVMFSLVLSYLVQNNLSLNFDLIGLAVKVPFVAATAIISFLIVGSYKGVVRHTGVRDVYNIFNAVCLFSILITLAMLINQKLNLVDEVNIPLSIIIINSFICFVSLVSSRFVFKSFYQKYFTYEFSTSIKNVLIYGAGESGVLTQDAIRNLTKSNAKVVGFIDYDKKKIGKLINGARVFSPKTITKEFIEARDIREVVFCVQEIEAKKLNRLVEGFVDYDVVVKIVPPVEDWINGELKVSQIKNIQIEDLLNRAPIELDNSKIKDEVKGKKVLITGGAGSIGSEIVRQVCNYDYDSLIIIDQAESDLYDLQQELFQKDYHNFIPIVGDVRDKKRMNQIFEEYKPNIVFHAAAYKHVPLMEYNSYEAIKINVAGTKVIADLSSDHGADKFILVSTDKAVNPTNIMGASKRIAEMYVSCMNRMSQTKYITTRFGNVLGSKGSVIPLFRKQIETGGPITLTHREITRYFMTIPEASQLVLEAGAMGNGGEIFIFDMGESVKIYDLAKNMIKLSGLNYPNDIDIKVTGLRPGEKLYEELLANGENTMPTYHKKIKISKVRELDYETVKMKIDELCMTNMFMNKNTVKLMKLIVPEYISKNSTLSEFDTANDKEGVDNDAVSLISNAR
jgi:FlaA1/EpsC-like NDP-sugar epimerase